MAYPHPIENIMKTTMEQLREMVDVSTIISEPIITPDGGMIVPVSKVSLGFLSGGGEYNKGESIMRKKENIEYIDDIRYPFAGTSAAGISLTPTAFLVVIGNSVKVIPAQYDTTIDRIIEMIPRTIEEAGKLLDEFSKKPKHDHKCCKNKEKEKNKEKALIIDDSLEELEIGEIQ